jgi:hypothetical protein
MANTQEIKYVRDIDDETRDEIESMLDDGMVPLAIHKEIPDVPRRLIESINRMRKRVPLPLAGQGVQPFLPPTGDPETASLRASINDMDIQERKMQMREQYNLMIERQRLMNNQMRIDQRRQALELEADYSPEQEALPEAPQGTQNDDSDPFPHAAVEGEFGVLRDILGFATAVMKKNDRPAPVITVTPTTPPPVASVPDFTKPLSEEQIRAEIKKFETTHGIAAIKQAANFPGMVESNLKKAYPGIIPENIKAVNDTIKQYVNNTEPTDGRVTG